MELPILKCRISPAGTARSQACQDPSTRSGGICASPCRQPPYKTLSQVRQSFVALSRELESWVSQTGLLDQAQDREFGRAFWASDNLSVRAGVLRAPVCAHSNRIMTFPGCPIP